ncbi:hypothetical protein C8Q73DRAFT_308135 [Cubamyces lactineus]|nr:hypothetical protein C8Q73DRAFT_308135 [Cubamyces lactineus]
MCLYSPHTQPSHRPPDLLAIRLSPATSSLSTVTCRFLYIARRLPVLCFFGLLLTPCKCQMCSSSHHGSACVPTRVVPELLCSCTLLLVCLLCASWSRSVRAIASPLVDCCTIASAAATSSVQSATASSSPSSSATRRIRTVHIAHRSLSQPALYNTAIVCHSPTCHSRPPARGRRHLCLLPRQSMAPLLRLSSPTSTCKEQS